MTVTVYDQHAGFYVDFVDAGLRDAADLRHQLLARFEALVGDRVTDASTRNVASGPFRAPDEPQFLEDDAGVNVAVVVRRYASEGHWQSGGSGVRGRMGAHHRTLATLLNDLIGSGFALERIEEPVAEGTELSSQVPRSLLVTARRA